MTDKPLKVIAGAPDRPLRIGDVEIPCYVLEDETRVLVGRGMVVGMGMSLSAGGQRLSTFMSSKSIKPFISKGLTMGIQSPIFFKTPLGGITAHGYPATLLVELCEAVLQARDAKSLTRQQLHIAQRCDLLIRGLATVGIVALVDEATGYQEVRERNALATILEKFIAKKLHPWTKTFSYSFYEEICRLKGWPGWYAVQRPHVIAEYTNDFVYMRIAPGVLREVQKLNPINPKTGERIVKHHQWFTEDYGHPRLREHIASVTALMRASANWGKFKSNLVRAFPTKYDNQEFPFMDEED